MKISVLTILIFLGFMAFLFISAGEKPIKTTPRKIIYPKSWPKPNMDLLKGNSLTEEGFALGKKLFYDGLLSADGKTSCGNCHQPFAAFASLDHDFSHGIGDSLTTRNSPTLANLLWKNSWHWDGGVNHLEVQPLSPITAPNEMGETLENVLKKLNVDTAYQRLFYRAFGSKTITSKRLMQAITQYTSSIVSSTSKYDKVMAGTEKFTEYEEKGYLIFKANCISCHKEPLFTDNSFRNNGMTLNRFGDAGRQRITRMPSDSLKFAVPTLRNAQVTHPYMHDGRIYSLPQVVDHYFKKMNRENPLLDSSLRKLPVGISDQDKMYLLQFLYTLTDREFLGDGKYLPGGAYNVKH